MALAITIWNNRISPVFDVATCALIIKKDSSGEQGRHIRKLSNQIIQDLLDNQIDELICGAVSKRIYRVIESHGIKVYPFISGDVEFVINAWQQNRLHELAYSMPGCHRRKRLHCCKIKTEKEML